MEVITIIYLWLGGFTLFALFLTVMVIAGRDIFFAFYRRFSPKGNDVFIITPTRHVNHHYKTPKDNYFEIKKLKYIINPDKQHSIKDSMKEDVKKSLDIRRKRIEKNIQKIDDKLAIINKQVKSLSEIPENVPVLENLKLQLAELENKKEKFIGKLKARDKGFYMRRRGAYFYLENDPIPKDWFELFSEMDGKQLENIIIRAQTKDAKQTAEVEKALSWIKKFIIFAIIAGGLGAWFAFQNHSSLQQIAEKIGITLTL